MADLHIGIMSGTSLDGADAVLADWEAGRALAFATRTYPPELRAEILALCSSGADELERAGDVSNKLARLYASVASDVLELANIRKEAVRSIGCHGQTVRHRPDRGFSIQLQNPALLAELAGIDVVADFRSRDLAAAGQGAPLAPAFHDGVFRHAEKHRAVVNIGGISNISVLTLGSPVSGFDCGPGNILLDHWASTHLGTAFDEDGNWARKGRLIPELLANLVDEPYLGQPPPKSTGRELFNAQWLEGRLLGRNFSAPDVQATLVEFTAQSIVDAVHLHCSPCDEIIICGGGARNSALLERLRELSNVQVEISDAYGLPAGQVEAMAFAWFAKHAMDRIPMRLERITGAKHPVILGAIYPA